MSRRFITLLERLAWVREMIDREQRSGAPSPVRLIRMKQLYLRLSQNLRQMTKQRLIRMASAPRFKSRRAFSMAPARTLPGGW
ncbi:hypothetical protein [Hyphomicrobium sp.]|uniref:hypothetical protein n=1 Tax=Hyphomicrobium sp. TaxID=82 RepID=UPI002D778DE9|nr:hypothetical protein [Hyphomicrobium sp.]HET6390950.1 hypothetical protein [Hyphomicrobium sp.]